VDVDTHEQGERCTSLAKGTASVELASRAERTTAAKPEALEPGAYGGVGAGVTSETAQQGESGRARTL
jgi:hypothetical protein